MPFNTLEMARPSSGSDAHVDVAWRVNKIRFLDDKEGRPRG